MKIRMVIDIEIERTLAPNDKEERDALYDMLLQRGHAAGEALILHSNYIGDELGTVTVIDIQEESTDA
jgi:hypothetical protein